MRQRWLVPTRDILLKLSTNSELIDSSWGTVHLANRSINRPCHLSRGCMPFLEDFNVFSEISENAYKIFQAPQYDCLMEISRKFAMRFAKNLWFFRATHKTFCKLQVSLFAKFFSYRKIIWKFSLVLLQYFPFSLENFSCTFFISTCNQSNQKF